ncbi:MAG: transporter [Burkholderiaceae bacterium]
MPSIRRFLSAASWSPPCQAALLTATLLAASPSARAGEGGTSHVLPGANATLMDVIPTVPGAFFKPMYLHYSGDATARVPTAAGITSNLNATANTLVVGGGYTFEPTVFGGAHYTVGAFLPYTSLNVSGNVQTPRSPVARSNKVSGLGDMTLVPAMLAWKEGDWQIDALLPIYAPTGSYQKGRLGNPGLNYWTFDPMIGMVYSNKKSGFNALLHLGYGINTENTATAYKSGSILHLDGALQQIIPVKSGFLTVGAEGFYFDQVTGDSGAGASLGAFKGRTAGLGPVLGFIQPIGKQSLALELKWLAELDTRNRMKGDYLWLKAVYKF